MLQTTHYVCRRTTVPGQLVCSQASLQPHAITVTEGRRLYDPERHRFQYQLYGGHDPGRCARYLGAQVYWLLGYPSKALALCGEGLALANPSAHPFTLLCALQAIRCFTSIVASRLALQRLKAAEALAAEQRLGFVFEPQLLRGAALTAFGDVRRCRRLFARRLVGRSGGRHGCDATA